MDPEVTWERRVHQLKQFREANGHCNVPEEYPENQPLARWVSMQRVRYQPRQQGRESKLTDDNIAELESMGFLWNLQTSKPKEKTTKFEYACFDQRVQELKAYRDTNGHCGVPTRYEPNKALGCWVNKVRTQYKWRGQGKKTSLTDARISELDNLGFVWNGNAGLSRDVWMQRVEELIEYRDTNGHCRVPARYEPNKVLGWWVSKVRTQYTWRGRGKKTSLTDAHISELDGLGFVWKAGTEGPPRDEVWKKRVQELTAYRDTNGHSRVPFLYEPNKALGRWVNKVRTQYTSRGKGKKTPLTDARVSELDGLGFVWKVWKLGTKEGLSGDELWKKRVQELVAYRYTNGHCRVPFLDEPNKVLGHWVSTVRTQYTWRVQGKKTSLTDARISELDSLGFVWEVGTKEKEGSPRDGVWKKRVQELTAFNNKYPETYPLNPLLLHKQTEELLQKLLSRRRNDDLYLWALRSYLTISPPPVPLQGAPRNVLPQTITAMLQSNNQISPNPSPASNAGLNAPPPVPLQEGAPRNVLSQSSTAMPQTSNQIPVNPSPASNAGFKDNKKFSCLDGMEEMFYAMRAEEKRREDEELKARHCRKPNMDWLL